jgi:hypothetical protein
MRFHNFLRIQIPNAASQLGELYRVPINRQARVDYWRALAADALTAAALATDAASKNLLLSIAAT